ncbi:MAG: prepilin-type N-terminal cleavage/methylation domain-containing protein [Halomonadaceae bacterium]|nr:MAG: prepilin-type N-terminal cleavage/methylation domain-containing protein [Halomonadaceae bacterium]
MNLQRSSLSLNHRYARGFTLVELMIVVLLVAVVAAIAVPNFRQLVENNRISAGTNSIVSTLSYARSEALRQGRRVTVDARVDGAWAQGLAVSQGTNLLRVSEPMGNGIAVTGNSLAFRGNGLATGVATFRICGSGNLPGREVSVTEGGRVQTREVSCNE